MDEADCRLIRARDRAHRRSAGKDGVEVTRALKGGKEIASLPPSFLPSFLRPERRRLFWHSVLCAAKSRSQDEVVTHRRLVYV